jgi:hypothetical protein
MKGGLVMESQDRFVMGFLFTRIDMTEEWHTVRCERSQSELWRGPYAWLGNGTEERVWVYVGVEPGPELLDFDLPGVAKEELAKYLPGALIR